MKQEEERESRVFAQGGEGVRDVRKRYVDVFGDGGGGGGGSGGV
jgi:hypothetical protein